jgi:hypothetical protein
MIMADVEGLFPDPESTPEGMIVMASCKVLTYPLTIEGILYFNQQVGLFLLQSSF